MGSITFPSPRPSFIAICEAAHEYLYFFASVPRFDGIETKEPGLLRFYTGDYQLGYVSKDSAMTLRHCIAVDLGASSGRVMLGRFDGEQRQLSLLQLHRFTNHLVNRGEQVCWDVEALEHEIRHGLQLACQRGITIDSIGIDTWGVDYVLIDGDGTRVAQAVAYRDGRTDGVMAKAQEQLGAAEIYRRTGIQFLPFNTLYQLRAQSLLADELSDQVAHALMIPDYLHYRLTGQLNWEYTNATTTQLLNIDSGEWDDHLLAWSGAPRHWFGKLTQPGTVIGHWQSPQGQSIAVICVATHDTASAVLATPLQEPDSAYLSSGTWSLMGFESRTPYRGADALAANITNEGGAEGRFRVLKNIMGLWLLQRVCSERAITDLPALIEQARQLPAATFVINPNDSRFINPPSMCAAIQEACRQSGQPLPQSNAELARCIFDSLALLYAEVLAELARLRGRPFSHLHVVGGGSQNHFLNQLCADACAIAVVAGPIEASTLGNIGCQLIALGELADVSAVRRLIAQSQPLLTFEPQSRSELARLGARYRHHEHLDKETCA